jgi:hypothetical protein
LAELVEDATTNQQQETDAEFKAVVSANSAGRRSSRAMFPSSSNLNSENSSKHAVSRINLYGNILILYPA